MSVTIYHNPRCSKSRETLKLLEDRGIRPQIIEYLKTPPSTQELRKLLGLLEVSARDLLRSKEEAYKTLGLQHITDESQLIGAMHDHPVLIERPIVVVDGKRAAVGRPPENVLKIL